MKQYIYKICVNNLKSSGLEEFENSNFEVIFISNALKLLPNFFRFISYFGFTVELFKICMKICLKRNVLYVVLEKNLIVSDGLITFGHCNYYKIGKNDCVIGPVHTDSECRGKGLATIGLYGCVNYLISNFSLNYAYIDTTEDNFAMQKVISKVGFGQTIDFYERK